MSSRKTKSKLEKLSSIKDRGQTDRVTALPRPYALDFDLWPLILIYDPDFQSQVSYGHDPYTVQRSVGWKDRVETNGRTDGRRR